MSDRPQLPPGSGSHTPHSAVPPLELTRTVESLLHTEDVLPPPKPTTEMGWLGYYGGKLVDISIMLLALVNLSLVLFDYTYLDLRHQYQAYFPAVARLYDPLNDKSYELALPHVVPAYDKLKGIEPHRDTDNFVKAARDTLKRVETAPDAAETAAALAAMRAMSADLIEKQPFNDAGLRGVFEQTKNRVRKHMHARVKQVPALAPGLTPLEAKKAFDSSKTSWSAFWTLTNLTPHDLALENQWFENQMAPLMNRNYFRTYGENGKPTDYFWLIDCLFLPIFLLEFLIRGAIGVKNGTYHNFKAFFATRWYDAVYFIPPLVYLLPATLQGPFHLVRMISVGYRMQRLGLINPVAIVNKRVAKGLDLVTDLVNVKLIGNYQKSVADFDLKKAMQSLTPQQRKHLTVLIERNLNMVLRDVLPDVTPQLENLITRTATQAMEQAPAYQQLKRIPLFGALPEAFIPTLVGQIISGTQVTMLKALNDPENMRLTNEMIDKVTESLILHMAEVGTEKQIKTLLLDLLEEEKRKVLMN